MVVLGDDANSRLCMGHFCQLMKLKNVLQSYNSTTGVYDSSLPGGRNAPAGTLRRRSFADIKYTSDAAS